MDDFYVDWTISHQVGEKGSASPSQCILKERDMKNLSNYNNIIELDTSASSQISVGAQQTWPNEAIID